MLGIIFALLAGLLMSVQGVFNTRLMASSNIWTTNIWVQFTALLVCMGVWLFAGRSNLFEVFHVSNKIYLFGGIIGAFITFFVIKSIGKSGPIYATMLILLAQLVTACLIETLGLFGTEKIAFEWHKILGVGLMIAGIIIFKK
jgi:transporter family-2 protein